MRVTNNKAQNREGIPAQRSEELQFQPFNDERDERASENSIAEQIQDSLGKQFGESAKCISKFMPDMETLKKYSDELKSKVNEVVIEQTFKNIMKWTSNEEKKNYEESSSSIRSTPDVGVRSISPESVAETSPPRSEQNGIAVNSMSVGKEKSVVLQKPEEMSEVQTEGETEKS